MDLRLPLLFFQFLLQRERVPQLDDLKGFDNALHSSLRWDSHVENLSIFQIFHIVSYQKGHLPGIFASFGLWKEQTDFK